MDNLGPLELVLNTASHHRVHHGANRYCLDKNYGGFLSVWDRIFGTFQVRTEDDLPRLFVTDIDQDLRTDQEIVYGLIDQPKFFDVIRHQLFYFPLLLQKVSGSESWWDRIAVWIKGNYFM